MLLRPHKPGDPVPPLVLEGGGLRASVTLDDGVPVLAASGPARFTLKRVPRKFGRRGAEEVPEASLPVRVPLRRGDVLTLSAGAAEHSWSYDPDGNLPTAGRIVLWVAREGMVPLVVAAAVAVISMVYLGELTAFGGAGHPGNPLPKLIRQNADKVYPRKAQEPSAYLRALTDAGREGRDVEQASREWIAAHGQPTVDDGAKSR